MRVYTRLLIAGRQLNPLQAEWGQNEGTRT